MASIPFSRQNPDIPLCVFLFFLCEPTLVLPGFIDWLEDEMGDSDDEMGDDDDEVEVDGGGEGAWSDDVNGIRWDVACSYKSSP
jgi:hypothetical protein